MAGMSGQELEASQPQSRAMRDLCSFAACWLTSTQLAFSTLMNIGLLNSRMVIHTRSMPFVQQ